MACQRSLQEGTAFYDKVLCSYSRYSAFIAIDVQSKEYTGRAVIQNNDLYYFFKKTRGYDEKNYEALMKEKLLNKDSISFGDVNLKKWRFFKESTINSVQKHASKGTKPMRQLITSLTRASLLALILLGACLIGQAQTAKIEQHGWKLVYVTYKDENAFTQDEVPPDTPVEAIYKYACRSWWASPKK